MKKAASFAALISETLGTEVDMQRGRRGQFEIAVDGRTVITRKGGLLARLLGRPWPSDEEVLRAVRGAKRV